MIFDTHAHLNDSAFDEDREELISGLPEKGIGFVMNVGCCLDSSKDCIALAEKYPFIYASVGSHPDSAGEVCEELMQTYLEMSKHSKVKAIGEIGLDYYYEGFDREIQIKAFEMQMELARQAQLPVIVHERDAHGDGMDIVRKFPDVTGVFHCYSGAAEMARQLVDLGWYIGFTGVLTFKNASDYEDIQEGDKLTLSNVFSGMDEGEIVLNNLTKNAQYSLVANFTERQKEILKAGGLLAYTKNQE